jgi:2-polyprenyl-6-methoxyphenol hydroxylase-like FAD-dependent oxidoreductase
MRIVVAGGGIAGLAAALLMSRKGHDVVLIERDCVQGSDTASAAFLWDRRGIPHFRQPHSFLPRGRAELRKHLPDVYESLISAGAGEVEVWRRLPGDSPQPTDREITYVAVRRPVIEWALRNAVLCSGNIEVRSPVKVQGLVAASASGPDLARICGIRTNNGEEICGDFVVDATGRSSRAAQWLAELGAESPRAETAECGIVYYSRYYQLRSNERFPEGPWLLSPRGDLGYAAYASFFGDNQTFAAVLAVAMHDHDLKILQHEPAFTAVCTAIPQLAQFLAVTDPVSDVMAMGGLQNVLRDYLRDHRPIAPGLLPVGDAVCHTDPMFALGLSFSLIHAVAAAEEIGADVTLSTSNYLKRIEYETRERFELAKSTDAARNRSWAGERLDFTRKTGCFPLFALVAAAVAAVYDPAVFRSFTRRTGFLDRTAVFDNNTELHQKIEAIVSRHAATIELSLSRESMLDLANRALMARIGHKGGSGVAKNG